MEITYWASSPLAKIYRLVCDITSEYLSPHSPVLNSLCTQVILFMLFKQRARKTAMQEPGHLSTLSRDTAVSK